MVAMDFPASPTDGQVYLNYIYNSAKGAWKAKPLTPGQAQPSATPPTSPNSGDQWYNTNDGTLYIWYNDGNTSQWVESRAPITANGYYSPNYVINGGMDIWQRATSFNYNSPQGTFYTADRWAATNAGGSGTPAFTISRQAGVSSVTQYALRFQRNSGSTATTYGYLAYGLESIDSIPLAGKQITLSFYARSGPNYSPTSSLITTRIATGTGTDQSINNTGLTGQINNDFATTLTSSWQRFSYSITVPTSATQIALQWFAQFTGTAGANDYVEITGVQLEAGSTATPFRRNANSIQGELAACQRYYQRWSEPPLRGVFTGSNTAGRIGMPLIVQMRTTPSAALSGTLQAYDGANTPTLTTIITNHSKAHTVEFDMAYTGTGTAGNPAILYQQTSGAYMEFSAEL